MDALTYGEPSKAKKSVLRKIEEQAEELAYLQRKCRELGIPVLIVVEGLSCGFGKGTIINQMIQPLDPRGFKVTCIASPSRDEQLRPLSSGASGGGRLPRNAWRFSTAVGTETS